MQTRLEPTAESQIETTAQPVAKPPGPSVTLDNEMLVSLAKRRLFAKRSLFWQCLDYLLIVFCSILHVFVLYENSDQFILAFFLCSFFGVRLLFRFFQFMKPSFKDGIAAYFKQRRRQQLEDEYSRLEKMSAEHIVELSK